MTSSRDLIQQARSTTEDVPRTPRKGLVVVTCMDTRIDPLAMYNARVGDFHVIRNAGGLVNGDVLRGLLISQLRANTTAIDLVMHTDCAVLGLRDDEMRKELGSPSLEFGGFDDLEATLRDGVASLQAAELLPHRDRITGYIFDVETRRLRRVTE